MMKIIVEHDKRTVAESLQLTEQRADYFSVLIFYQTIADYLHVKEKFGVDLAIRKGDSIKETVPADYRTTTGGLSRILPYCQNDQESAYLLLSYLEKRQAATKIVGLFNASKIVDVIEEESETGFSGPEKERAEFIKKMFAPDPKVKAFLSYIEDSNGSFEVFRSLIPADDPFDYMKDVMESMLTKIKLIELLGGRK